MSHFEHRDRKVGKAVARELREAAARRHVSLAALSASTGIPQSTLTRKIRGHGELTVTELVRLAVALDVPAADLLEAAVTEEPGAQK